MIAHPHTTSLDHGHLTYIGQQRDLLIAIHLATLSAFKMVSLIRTRQMR